MEKISCINLRIYSLLIAVLIVASNYAQDLNNPLDAILKSNDKSIKTVIDAFEKYEIQVIYTQVDRDSLNFPYLKTYRFNADAYNYFYPASVVKLPVALLALEKLNSLKKRHKELTRKSNFKISDSFNFDKLNNKEIKNSDNSIEKCIKEIFVVSDNKAFNDLYEFLGSNKINKSLENK